MGPNCPTRLNLVLQPLAALHLDNQLNMPIVIRQLCLVKVACTRRHSMWAGSILYQAF